MSSTPTMILSIVALSVAALILPASCQQPIIANIPGGQTASAALASSVDGMSRYLAPDGPIQPALTAIGTLPVRAVEQVNKGISQISLGLDRGAQSLSHTAGQGGQIKMPGVDTIASGMPTSLTSLGNMMSSAVAQKNLFIAGQAESGIQAGERLRSMMQGGLNGVRTRREADPMEGSETMMMGAQDMMMKGAQQIKSQMQQHMSGAMDRLQGVQGIGDNVRNQVQGITRTLSNGLTGTMEHLQRTGEQVRGQIQGGLKQNMGAMSGIMQSMHGSMGNMGENMQKNVQGVMQHVQDTAQQVSGHIQQTVQGPLSMLQNLGGGLMKGGSGGGMSVSKGRY